jgi:hypothetical protein
MMMVVGAVAVAVAVGVGWLLWVLLGLEELIQCHGSVQRGRTFALRIWQL